MLHKALDVDEDIKAGEADVDNASVHGAVLWLFYELPRQGVECDIEPVMAGGFQRLDQPNAT